MDAAVARRSGEPIWSSSVIDAIAVEAEKLIGVLPQRGPSH
jgi:hypothetical protein